MGHSRSRDGRRHGCGSATAKPNFCASRTASRTASRWRCIRRQARLCTRAISRSIRRPSMVSTSTCTGSRSSAPPVCSRCSPTARTSIARDSQAPSSKCRTPSKRCSRRRLESSWSPRSHRACTGCRFSSTSPRSSDARWRLSGAACCKRPRPRSGSAIYGFRQAG